MFKNIMYKSIIGHPLSNKILTNVKKEHWNKDFLGYVLYEKGGQAVTNRYCLFYTGDLLGEKIFLNDYRNQENTKFFSAGEIISSLKTISEFSLALAEAQAFIKLKDIKNYIQKGSRSEVAFDFTKKGKIRLNFSDNLFEKTLEVRETGFFNKEITIDSKFLFWFLDSFDFIKPFKLEIANQGAKLAVIFTYEGYKFLISPLIK